MKYWALPSQLHRRRAARLASFPAVNHDELKQSAQPHRRRALMISALAVTAFGTIAILFCSISCKRRDAIQQPGATALYRLQHENYVTSARFSADSKRIVTASWDRTARVWDAETGQPLSAPMKHDKPVASAEFSPDGK